MAARLDDDDDGGSGKDTRGPGWMHDEAGRPYRLEKGTRVYQNGTDRDAATDESYSLSPQVQLAFGLVGKHQTGVPSMVAVEAAELAEMFWRECASVPGESVEDKLQRWEVKNFGRVLERVAHGILRFEVRHLETGRDRGTGALFSSVADQHRFEKAASETAHIKGTLERVQEICRLAGAPFGGPRDMPRLPYREPGDDDDAA